MQQQLLIFRANGSGHYSSLASSFHLQVIQYKRRLLFLLVLLDACKVARSPMHLGEDLESPFLVSPCYDEEPNFVLHERMSLVGFVVVSRWKYPEGAGQLGGTGLAL